MPLELNQVSVNGASNSSSRIDRNLHVRVIADGITASEDENGTSTMQNNNGHDSPARSVASSSSLSGSEANSESDTEILDEDDEEDDEPLETLLNVHSPAARPMHIGRTQSVLPGLGSLWPKRNEENFERGKQVPRSGLAAAHIRD